MDSPPVTTQITFGMGEAPLRSERLPPASLIICSRNRPDLLEDAVASILRGDEVPTELVIVDQSDTEHPQLRHLTTDRACAVRYIWTRSTGLCRARNDAIAATRHDLLVFADDDVIAPPAWFGNIVRALVAVDRRSVVTGQVLPTEPEIPGGFVPSLVVDDVPKVYAGRIGQDVLFTFNMAIYRSAVDDVGPFDERLGPGTRFPAAEDNDFGLRLLEAGYRILYTPEAALYHRAWRNERLRLRWRYGRGQGAYFAKHLSLRDRYIGERMLRLSADYLCYARGRARREPLAALGEIMFVAGMLSGAAEWLLTQRRGI